MLAWLGATSGRPCRSCVLLAAWLLQLPGCRALQRASEEHLASQLGWGEGSQPPQRVALAFRGHYHRNFPSIRGSRCSDFFLSEPNIKANVLQPLIDRGVNVSVYFHTVKTPGCPDKDKALVDSLKPVAYEFSDESLPTIGDSYIRVLQLVADNEKEETPVVMLRFDVEYSAPITSLDIRWDAFNYAFRDKEDKWDQCRKTSDLLFVLPVKFAPALAGALQGGRETRLMCPKDGRDELGNVHWTYPQIAAKVGEERLHFIESGFHSSDQTIPHKNDTFLGIDRRCRDPNFACSTSEIEEPSH